MIAQFVSTVLLSWRVPSGPRLSPATPVVVVSPYQTGLRGLLRPQRVWEWMPGCPVRPLQRNPLCSARFGPRLNVSLSRLGAQAPIVQSVAEVVDL
jgi:hypothetical protein